MSVHFSLLKPWPIQFIIKLLKSLLFYIFKIMNEIAHHIMYILQTFFSLLLLTSVCLFPFLYWLSLIARALFIYQENQFSVCHMSYKHFFPACHLSFDFVYCIIYCVLFLIFM